MIFQFNLIGFHFALNTWLHNLWYIQLYQKTGGITSIHISKSNVFSPFDVYKSDYPRLIIFMALWIAMYTTKQYLIWNHIPYSIQGESKKWSANCPHTNICYQVLDFVLFTLLLPKKNIWKKSWLDFEWRKVTPSLRSRAHRHFLKISYRNVS